MYNEFLFANYFLEFSFLILYKFGSDWVKKDFRWSINHTIPTIARWQATYGWGHLWIS